MFKWNKIVDERKESNYLKEKNDYCANIRWPDNKLLNKRHVCEITCFSAPRTWNYFIIYVIVSLFYWVWPFIKPEFSINGIFKGIWYHNRRKIYLNFNPTRMHQCKLDQLQINFFLFTARQRNISNKYVIYIYIYTFILFLAQNVVRWNDHRI